MNLKKKCLVAGLMLTLTAAGFSGLALSRNARVAKADPAVTDYIYLDNSDNWYQTNERYAAYFFTDGVGEEWVNFTWDEDLGYNKVERKAFDKVILCRMDKNNPTNNWSARWNQTGNLDNHAGIYKPWGASSTTVSGAWEYVLSVGETTTYMVPENTSKVQATVTAVAGDIVSLKSDEASAAGVLHPEEKTSNNMTSSCAIKVAGSTTIAVAKSGWSTWASGYAPASVNLQDFCDAILALDCDAKDLTGCGWDGLTPAEQADFNDADVVPGLDRTFTEYGNVVNEAATRYAMLVAKGAAPLEGVTLAAYNLTPVSIIGGQNNAIIIIIVTSIAVLSIAGLFFIRRRKEER